jgi:UDP-4-amino-4,6-dideoxy-N-acetyl-beta-L-altrosamine transaminase
MNHLPYGRQLIEQDDLAAVCDALRSDYLTTGPRVAEFERALADRTGARFASVCANGTAALHLANLALGIGPGDHVVVPAVTFLATANAARFVEAEVVFADVDPENGIMTAETLAATLARHRDKRIAAVCTVPLGGLAVDRKAIAALAAERGAAVIDDACHALGGEFDEGDDTKGRPGDCRYATLATFSFHPVKAIAMGEGGAVTANDPALKDRLDRLRNHGMARDAEAFEAGGVGFDVDGTPAPWAYEMPEPGYNYRASDIACALGLSQIAKLDRFIARRRAIAAAYDKGLEPFAPYVRPVRRPPGANPALHLYVVLIDFAGLGRTRGQVMRALAAQGIGTQVHYIPVNRQPYYRARYGAEALPGADAYYARCLSLPLHAGMTDADPARVIAALSRALGLVPGAGAAR